MIDPNENTSSSSGNLMFLPKEACSNDIYLSICFQGEEEEEVDDEEDDDNKFLVPHGYLSDDEGVHDDDDGMEDSGPCGIEETAEMKRLRQRLSLAEYETAHSRSMHKLKPLLLGPVWMRDPMESLRSMEAAAPTKSAEVEWDSDVEKENMCSLVTSEGRAISLPSRGEMELMQTALCIYTVCVDFYLIWI